MKSEKSLLKNEKTFCGRTEHEIYLSKFSDCRVSYKFSSCDIEDDDYNDWSEMSRKRQK